MRGGWREVLAALVLAALVLGAVPAAGHEKHKRDQAAARQEAGGPPTADPSRGSTDDHMRDMMEAAEKDRASMSTGARLLDWLGRLHPIIVHFPIAFFPAAFFTAIVGRRRPAFAKPVQFLVVAGGTIAPIAALLGWLDAIGADPDLVLTVHRWLGTAIGIAGAMLAVWAWKRPEEDRRPGMVWALAAITAAIIVQGWYGGALVHGMDHMNW
ncbi:MAG TPA: DUF2231 domain-containing protein [Allosphingosinicella sp.]